MWGTRAEGLKTWAFTRPLLDHSYGRRVAAGQETQGYGSCTGDEMDEEGFTRNEVERNFCGEGKCDGRRYNRKNVMGYTVDIEG